MTFKISRIAAAIGLGLVATSVFADPTTPNRAPANYTSGTSDIYLAGSSAVDLALEKFIANTCAAGSLDSYRTDASGRTFYLWTCESNAGANFGLTSGNTKIAIHKNTNSSADGTNLVTNAGGSLAYLQPADLTANAGACAVAPKVIAATATIPTYKAFNCGSTIAAPVGTHTVTFGFSDSEPAQFNANAAGEVTSVYPLTIVFGIPVTKNVRDLLQTAQGLSAGDESEAGMPTLTTSQINSIYTGRFTSWSSLGITVPGGDNKLYLVRRSNGSGTTRAFDVSFIGDFCTPGLTSITTATTLATATLATQCKGTGAGGTQKLQAGTSDDMAACLSGFQGGNVGAIGYLSTDYTPATADGYRWIKVDGNAPKQLNVADGKWKDWSEESLNYNTAAGIANDDLAFYNAIQVTSSSGVLMSEIAQNLPQTTSGLWTGGVMGSLPSRLNGGSVWGVPTTGLNASGSTVNGLVAPRTDASVLAYPANPASRATAGGYKLCAVPLPATGFQAQ